MHDRGLSRRDATEASEPTPTNMVTVADLNGTMREMNRRAESCLLLAAKREKDGHEMDGRRLRVKASAYAHAAEMLEADVLRCQVMAAEVTL